MAKLAPKAEIYETDFITLVDPFWEDRRLSVRLFRRCPSRKSSHSNGQGVVILGVCDACVICERQPFMYFSKYSVVVYWVCFQLAYVIVPNGLSVFEIKYTRVIGKWRQIVVIAFVLLNFFSFGKYVCKVFIPQKSFFKEILETCLLLFGDFLMFFGNNFWWKT